MSVKLCHHHGFTVSDADRSAAFYRDVLGLELVRISDRSNLPSYDHMLGYKDVKLRIAVLRHPKNEFILELVQYINPPCEKRSLENRFLGASHLAFEMEDVDKAYEAQKKAGFKVINPPADIIRDGVKVARGMYALDPDGISIEMFQEFEDVVRK
jgi:catechol 2,3-dioxygenase-like lactoylglutathione lyase family enzyme